MTEETTSNPFALFEQLAAARAAMTTEEQFGIDVDRTRLRRNAQRRERLGQLRAREHPGSRPFGLVHQIVK